MIYVIADWREPVLDAKGRVKSTRRVEGVPDPKGRYTMSVFSHFYSMLGMEGAVWDDRRPMIFETKAEAERTQRKIGSGTVVDKAVVDEWHRVRHLQRVRAKARKAARS